MIRTQFKQLKKLKKFKKTKIKMTQLYVYESLEIARKAADNAIDSYASGVEKFTMKRVVNSLLKNYDINPKDTRRAIADVVIAANKYPF